MPHLSDAALLRLNIEIEFYVGPGNELSALPWGDPQVPWVVVTRSGTSDVIYVNRELNPTLKEKLRKLAGKSLFEDPAAVNRAVEGERDAPVQTLEQSPISVGCVLEREPAHHEFTEVVERAGAFVVLRGVQTVARAWTVRGDARASELAVETDENFRRLGLGRQVVSAWAAATIRVGKVAFYSFRMDNAPSKALADSMGARTYGLGVDYSPAKYRSE